MIQVRLTSLPRAGLPFNGLPFATPPLLVCLVWALAALGTPAQAAEPLSGDAPAANLPPDLSPPAATPQAVPAARHRLLVLTLKGNDVDAATVDTLMGLVTAGLGEYPELDVISREDMKNLLQLEAEKSELGCSADASCMAEIADALGAELVVFGTAGRLDNSLVLNLNLFDSREATSLGRIVVQSESAKTMPRAFRPRLRDLVGKFYASRHLTLPPFVELPPDEVTPPPSSPLPWILVAAGGAALLGGTGAVVMGAAPKLQYDDAKARIDVAEATFARDRSALDDAKAAQDDLAASRAAWNSYGFLAVDIGAALAVGGLAALSTGVVLLALEPGAPDERSGQASSGGAQ